MNAVPVLLMFVSELFPLLEIHALPSESKEMLVGALRLPPL